MTIKTICILANSIKFGGRCIAGMEVISVGDNRWRLTQNWIRPISHREGGALQSNECQLAGTGNLPKLGEIVEIHLDKPATVAGQPEDWLIAKGQTWRRKNRFDWPTLGEFIQDPPHLWLEDAHRPDRVSPTYLRKKGSASLYLIHPENFYLAIWRKTYEGITKAKRRAIFDFKGVRYDLGLTDPDMQQKYFPDLRTRPEGPVRPGPHDIKAICISLTPELREQHAHFKLVAAVFD